MKRSLNVPTLTLNAFMAAAFASTSIAATVPADQAHTASAQNSMQTQQAQDSANGSMTNTNLSGKVDQDTSELTTGTTSGMTSGAIVDQTAKKKKKKKKKATPPAERSAQSTPATESEDTTSNTTSSGNYGTENLNAPTTTEGRTANDEIGLGQNGIDTPADRSENHAQSTTGGGGQ